jgi:hypothetical protein
MKIHESTVRRREARERTTSARARPRLALVTLVALAALASPATALGASGPPIVTTGAAEQVGYGSAVLSGRVTPDGSNTSYYFQYGPTRAYGGQSTIADAGTGTKPVEVSVPIGGLDPLTIYHYRLVAVNSAGATLGADRSFMTTKVPLSLQILAAPSPVAYGGTVTVQGTLSGTDNANREVVLQADAFPFTAGFQPLGNPELTNPSGTFMFIVPNSAVTTRYRVVTATNPAVVSPVAVAEVAVTVTSHIAPGRKGRGHARIYGTVTPAENGAEVGMLRIEHGRGVLVGGTRLKAAGATSSKFSREVPIRRGVYRVLVRVVGAGQVSSYGIPLLVR